MTKELSLEINKLCNFRCTFCYTEKYKEDLPDIDRVLNLIEEGIEEGVTSISMTGGEPLLQWDRVAEIARFAKSRRLRTRLNTNGILLEPSGRTNELLNLIDEFQISCNATSDREFAEYIQVKETLRPFSAILRNINHLLDHGAHVTIRFTLDAHTAHNLTAVFLLFCGTHELIKSRVVDRFKVRVSVPAGNIAPIGENVSKIKNASSQLFELLRNTPDAQVQFKDGNRLLTMPRDIPNLSSPQCICGERSIHISSDLRRVTPCVFLRDVSEFSLGNLRDGENRLREVWQNVRQSRFATEASNPDVCASDRLCNAAVIHRS